MTTHLYLAHHGIKGMKWGVRRYQDDSGRLTDAGKKRYAKRIARLEKKIDKRFAKEADAQAYNIVLTKRLYDDVKRNPKYYNNPKKRAKALDRYEKSLDRSLKTMERGKVKTIKLLQKAKNMGVDAMAESTVRTGHTYFVDQAAYNGSVYYERGTSYDVPIRSTKIRLT